MLLEGKNAIVTGSGQGIGRAIALRLAENGANVVISDVVEATALKVVEEIRAMGRQSTAVVCDVSKLDQCENLIEKSLEAFPTIDILVNNAGITRDNLLMRMKEADWDLVIAINLKGTFNCCKSVVRQMMKQRSGRIINIASVVGLMGNAGQVNYSASKAGVIGITKTLAKEFGSRGINVNAIAPGFIQTAMTDALSAEAKTELERYIPFQKLGTADDVANAALFLASPLSSYITGEVIRVDGGMAM
ncbi:MAG TPA: 3-oxoacyl-[acyl-carrier-protein] reductase [Candidatus Sumerlaeota bacterium]|nr:3-oxoacyl-[acyl-carrier-protein] reductase [Candidatus Sumerlaeota bacterium]